MVHSWQTNVSFSCSIMEAAYAISIYKCCIASRRVKTMRVGYIKRDFFIFQTWWRRTIFSLWKVSKAHRHAYPTDKNQVAFQGCLGITFLFVFNTQKLMRATIYFGGILLSLICICSQRMYYFTELQKNEGSSF